ncbi:MAG: DNA polymerase III subunit beta [Nitrospirae bacterium]|nr:DNA polymerase III subunit beta [Nitrospirota bacterium]
MKIKVAKNTIQKKLSNIQGVVENTNTMPILTHFLLDVNKEGSHILATDLETTLKQPVEAEVEQEGRVCIPARKFFEIVRELDGEIRLTLDKEGWLRVNSGASSFKLATLPAEDFPAWPEMEASEEITLNDDELLRIIEKTVFASGLDDKRYTLNGLLFHLRPENALVVVATDGHRLAAISKTIEGAGKESKAIVFRKAAAELKKLLDKGKVKVALGKNHALFEASGALFLTRLIEGTFPNYEQVIPQSNEIKVFLNREAFVKALRRASIISDNNLVVLDISNGSVVISSSVPDYGDSKEEIQAGYRGENLRIGFNARYLLEALGVMDQEEVVFEIQDNHSPAVLRGKDEEDYKYVVMPVRLG